MAGIGFSLQRLLTEDRLSSNARGAWHASLIAAGPWLFTCVALTSMLLMAQGLVGEASLLSFSTLAVLAFSVSMVVSGPLMLVLCRSLGDAVHAQRVHGVASVMFQSLASVFLWLAPIGGLLFGWVVDVPMADRVLGFTLLMVAGGLWIVASMLSSLRSYASVSSAFAIGLLVGCAVAYFTLISLQGTGLLLGLVVGLSVSFFALTARVLAEFPEHGSRAPASSAEAATRFDVHAAMRRHQGLAWAGLFYGAAVWIDKWIMWAAPEALEVASGVWSYPDYEWAMWFALLCVVPVLVLLLVDLEAQFHRSQQQYQQAIHNHGTLRDIRRQHGALMRLTAAAFRRLLLLQCVIAFVVVVASPIVMQAVGGGDEMASVFRFGVIGASFQGLLIVALAGLAYLDQQRSMMIATGLFLLLNTCLTILSMAWDNSFYGWGYAVAALSSFAFAFHAVSHAIAQLPYLTFVGTNTSIRDTSMPMAASNGGAAKARRPRSVMTRGAPPAG